LFKIITIQNNYGGFMRKKALLIMAVLSFIFGIFTITFAQDKTQEKAKVSHEYVGAKKCIMCHKKDGTGPSWKKTPHAGAWENVDTLKLEDKKKEECKGCHSTGVTAKGVFLDGVQCEACHGPGSDYKKMKIMKDHKLAAENGLLMPNEKTCLGCHNPEKAPKPYHSKMAAKFDFAKMKAKGIHDMPVKEKSE
jgi:cytochrome c551/c552